MWGFLIRCDLERSVCMLACMHETTGFPTWCQIFFQTRAKKSKNTKPTYMIFSLPILVHFESLLVRMVSVHKMAKISNEQKIQYTCYFPFIFCLSSSKLSKKLPHVVWYFLCWGSLNREICNQASKTIQFQSVKKKVPLLVLYCSLSCVRSCWLSLKARITFAYFSPLSVYICLRANTHPTTYPHTYIHEYLHIHLHTFNQTHIQTYIHVTLFNVCMFGDHSNTHIDIHTCHPIQQGHEKGDTSNHQRSSVLTFTRHKSLLKGHHHLKSRMNNRQCP